jgi:hypothetical protein
MTIRLGLLGLVLLGACGAESGGAPDFLIKDERVAQRQQEIRPTDGTGWNGNGFGVPAQVYDPPGGHFRVYYVTTGENAVDLRDVDPKDGVPDFVAQVGAAAEETFHSTVTQRGFRPPLDDSKYHDRPDYGGDARYDIYLRWSGKGSDGYRVTEACTDGNDGGSPGRCAGYFVMNPSYKDGHYPSELEGIRVLTSHELFHSVQDAYGSGQWRTWSEGTAVWNELQVFPTSVGTWQDYLGFVPALFREPERPFDKSMGSGPAASYAYGTAVFAEFLSERFGPQLIRNIWEGCEQSPSGEAPLFLDVLDAELRKHSGQSLVRAFTEFTRWNLLTAERASMGRGYQRAKEYPGIKLEPALTAVGQRAAVEVNGLSARYLRLMPTLSQATAIQVTVVDPASETPTAAAAVWRASGEVSELSEVGMGIVQTLSPGDSLLVVVTGAVRGARARMVEVNFAAAPTPPILPSEPELTASGCSLNSQRTPTEFAGLLTLLGLACLNLLRRQHRTLRARRTGRNY